MSEGSEEVCTNRLGDGTVVWTSAPVGMEYYLREGERPARLAQITEMTGPSEFLDGRELPSTVGVFCWQAADGQTLFADLVNYAFDPEADRVTVAEDLRLRMRLPRGTTAVEVTTLSPDEGATATANIEDGWAAVQLPRLQHYASVKLVAR